MNDVPESNKKAVRRYLDLLHNRRDADAASIYLDDDYTHHIPHYETRGFQEVRKTVEASTDGMPDRRLVIEHQVAEGDFVVTWGRFEGTHTGLYHGYPPTGRKVSFSAMFIHRLRGGRLIEHWNGSDRLDQLLQLGARINPPAS